MAFVRTKLGNPHLVNPALETDGGDQLTNLGLLYNNSHNAAIYCMTIFKMSFGIQSRSKV